LAVKQGKWFHHISGGVTWLKRQVTEGGACTYD